MAIVPDYGTLSMETGDQELILSLFTVNTLQYKVVPVGTLLRNSYCDSLVVADTINAVEANSGSLET